MDAVESEPGERLIQPLRRMFGLVDGFALHAAAGIARGVDRVYRALRAEGGGVRVPHGGAGARPVHRLGHDHHDLQAALAHPAASAAWATGNTGSQSHTTTSTMSPAMRRSISTGPGAYLRALVTSSLTTSWIRSMTFCEAGIPFQP